MTEVRDRLSDRVSRERFRLEASRSVRSAIVLIVGIGVGLACAVWVATNVSRTVLTKTHTVRFALDDATAITKGLTQVRVRGIPAGTVTSVEVGPDGAVATAKLKSEYGDIYKDATAVVRPNTPLQDMYIDVTDQGTRSAGALGSGDILSKQHTDTSVNVADVLNVFQADTRARLGTMLDVLGNGLADRGRALRQVFVQVVPFLTSVDRVTSQLAARKRNVRRLVRNSAVLTRTLADRDTMLRTLVDDGSSTLAVLQSRAPQLRALLHELPFTLTTADRAFASLRAVLPKVDEAVVGLHPAADRLPGALTALRGASTAAVPALDALQTPVRRLVPLAGELRPVSRNLTTALGDLSERTQTIDKLTRDLAGCETGITGFFQWNTSMSKIGSAHGAFPRGNVTASGATTGATGSPDVYAPQACVPGGPLGARPSAPKDKH